ncbi:hypothetical protein QPM04_26990, partial [Massilia varians]|uniref:hypothetical protein n=1 Tax=Massilia varians TaxID=457921 RepID=UPI00255686D6
GYSIDCVWRIKGLFHPDISGPHHEFAFPFAFPAQLSIVSPSIAVLICLSLTVLIINDLVRDAKENDQNKSDSFY